MYEEEMKEEEEEIEEENSCEWFNIRYNRVIDMHDQKVKIKNIFMLDHR